MISPDNLYSLLFYMDEKMNIKSTALTILIPLLLTACAPKTSVERNASHVAQQIAQLNFDPNMRSLTADNTQRATVFLQQFYDLGKKDHAQGITPAQAQERVNSFRSIDAFAAASQGSTFVSHKYEAEQPKKQAELMLNAATTTYWDGYNGKP
ncbi:Exc2 family lipoprotein [Candidatus Pantoea multigeneris]|uniref:Exc2 family lipoprotein n=1 Tax=Candidatus Pantoea multigeneris TaxID=2608357 RepID=A0ABX0RE87_9GAMM|nr:Exc2 family lipoprotein [Pantoea multigeneris]